MRRRLYLLVMVVFAALSINAGVLAQGDTIFGLTAEQLFPDAVSDVERDRAFAALQAANMPDATDLFAGQTLTVGVQQAGARGAISGPYYFWRPAFEAVTGATLEIVEIPQQQLYTAFANDFLTGTNTYDVMNVGSWYYGDMIPNGWLRPIDEFMGNESYPYWEPENVAPAIADLLQWQGHWYGVVNDGDTQLLYYRRDILSDPEWQAAFRAETGMDLPNPPTTWQQLLAVTSFFNGRDWNGDGDPDDGISLHLRSGGQGHFHFQSLSAPFVITPAQGDNPRAVTRYHNVYWFDPVDMTPLLNSPGHLAALEFLQELAATGSESQFGWDLSEAWNNFLTGNAIATFSWGDVGSLSQLPDRSTITGHLGGAQIPCSERWYDLETEQFVEDAENPNCVGNVTGGSWHPVMSAFTDTPELAYYFMAWDANPAINFFNITTGWMGTDPNSTFHLFPPRGNATVDDYAAFGFNPDDAESYITGYGENLFAPPISMSYLRIPGTVQYTEILDIHLAEALTGQLEPQAALDLIVQEFDEVTDDLGRDAQRDVYDASIGYTPE
jgi:multiple sugar transport system substrate-binding protein